MSPDSVQPPYKLYDVQVTKAERITPRLKRLTVDARHVPGLRSDLPGQWLKVFVQDAAGRRLPSRAYTVRRLGVSSSSVDVDFVLHGDEGNVSAWVARAVAGDHLEVSAPHSRSGIAIDPEVRRFILAGDETGFPAIASILEALPAGAEATVLIEVADKEEQQLVQTEATLNLSWLHRDAREHRGLARAMRSIDLPSHSSVFVAAESGEVAAIRTWLRQQRYAGHVHASGYWKRGAADHRDSGVD